MRPTTEQKRQLEEHALRRGQQGTATLTKQQHWRGTGGLCSTHLSSPPGCQPPHRSRLSPPPRASPLSHPAGPQRPDPAAQRTASRRPPHTPAPPAAPRRSRLWPRRAPTRHFVPRRSGPVRPAPRGPPCPARPPRSVPPPGAASRPGCGAVRARGPAQPLEGRRGAGASPGPGPTPGPARAAAAARGQLPPVRLPDPRPTDAS